MKWERNDRDIELYHKEEQLKQEKLTLLRIKLQKFIAKRNISYNLETVFLNWRAYSQLAAEVEKTTISAIEDLR